MDQLQQSKTVMTPLNLKLTDLKNSFIQVKAKIVNADGELLGATRKLSQ